MKASVVIPTYNRRHRLRGAIEPLLQDPATSEVVVVVDGCKDGSIELLEDWAKSEPRIRPVFQENAGQGQARQTGIDAASGEVVVILDDDVIAGTDLVTRHLAHHTEDSHRIVLGYMPIRLPESRARGQVPTMLYSEDYEKECSNYEADVSNVFDSLWSGNMSMRREDAQKIGFTGETRLGYHEDREFGFRCRDAGFEPVFDRSIVATHSHTRSLEAFAKECRTQGVARVVLARRYPGVVKQVDFRSELPGPVRLFVNVASAPVVHGAVVALLHFSAAMFGRLHVWTAETFAVRLLRQVEVYNALEVALKQSKSVVPKRFVESA